ncbi:uncharacterized protein LOC115312192, partial [Ixodes scapularis]|uniref:uncharacterized protein LOC115312192 n=1 Tax=Ixodes scapularis TaxID=6945 RepID=UPI001C37E9A1
LKIYKNISSLNGCALLQEDINAICLWCKDNGLDLNIGKTYVISFTRKTNPTHFLKYLENSSITRVTIVKVLGVMLDSKLNFNSHATYVLSSCFRLLGAILRFSKCFISVYLFYVLYRNIVLPKHDFCTVIWNSLSATASNNLERVQKRLARTYHFRSPSHDLYDYNEVLRQFQITNLASRRCSRDHLFLFKCIHSDHDLSSLVTSINYHIPGRNVRSSRTFHVNYSDFTSPSGRLQNYFNHVESDGIDIFNHNQPHFRECLLHVLK